MASREVDEETAQKNIGKHSQGGFPLGEMISKFSANESPAKFHLNFLVLVYLHEFNKFDNQNTSICVCLQQWSIISFGNPSIKFTIYLFYISCK